jgi:FMN-dependent oxidoreductase (nitrilotriacetate monooxygenase family)
MTRARDVVLFWMPEWGGFHVSAWREPEAPLDPMSFGVIRDMVRTAERGKFHGCFLADSLAIGFEGAHVTTEALSRTAKGVRVEPITLLAALSACTSRIGLLATASTTYNEPFHVARMFASLDHLSEGRAGWNVVTSKGSGGEAQNFGRDEHMEHDLRYERGQEFVDAVVGLWDSWEDDAFVRDKQRGICFDPTKLHAVNYRGAHLSVAGPLNISRPPQGHPVIAQAGSSPAGRAFAACNADVVYTLQADISKGREFYSEIKELVAEHGRAPEHVKILPALKLIVGHSQSDAEDKLARMDAQVDPEVGMEQLSKTLGIDMSVFPLDGPVPEVPETDLGSKGGQQYYLDLARRDNLTVRQLMQVTAGHGTIAGTPRSIADLIQDWVESRAGDGVNVTFADAIDSLNLFVNEVVPLLQERGVFHGDYRGATLRENLGIPRPRNQFAPLATSSRP